MQPFWTYHHVNRICYNNNNNNNEKSDKSSRAYNKKVSYKANSFAKPELIETRWPKSINPELLCIVVVVSYVDYQSISHMLFIVQLLSTRPDHVMLLLRTRYLWFVIVSVIYVLLVFVLHRNLHHFNVPDMSDDAADVEGRQWIIDDYRRGLAFPVVRHCVGQSGAPPSRLVPLGSDWLYTAYFDDRLKLSLNSSHDVVYIRVLALLRRRGAADFNRRPTFYFRWLQSETGNTTTSVAETYEMCENHGRRYGGWILSTKFIGRLPPCSVAVTQNLTSDDQVRLPLFRTSADDLSTVEEEKDSWMSGVSLLRGLRREKTADRQEKKLQGNFAVCVPPLYGTLMPATLVQFIELTRLLGAEHFVFYVGSVSEPIRGVLDAYEADDLLTTIPWVLPAVAAQSVWNNAQLLAVNDCLYRTSHAFQHVAFNDVDEFIVPHSAMNWPLMLAELTAAVDGRPRRRRPDRQRTSQLQRTSRQIRLVTECY